MVQRGGEGLTLTHWGQEFLPLIWATIKPFVQIALQRGSQWSVGDVYRGLVSRELDLFTVEDPELLCVLVTWRTDGCCILLTLGGFDMARWIHFIEEVEQWARSNGCERMRIQGRDGWSRVLGYTITGKDDIGLTTMEKKL